MFTGSVRVQYNDSNDTFDFLRTLTMYGFKKWGILQENALPYWDECSFRL